MYSTCLFCNSSLGRNEAIEHFPVGRRLAFDAEKGRLWVVCRKCARWNLTPLEERWEAIEEAERLFRDTRLRVSTEHVGLARVKEGLELVRIGRPQRPEFAAWRYGDQFGRRRLKTIAAVGGAVVVGGVMLATGSFAVLKAAVPGGGILWQLPNLVNMYRMHRVVVARVPHAGGELSLKLGGIRQVELIRQDVAEGWAMRLPDRVGHVVVHGPDAVHLAGKLLARLNHAGAFQRTVQEAVARLETSGGPDAFILRSAKEDRGYAKPPGWTWSEGARSGIPQASLARLASVDRLALEMAANEESERRALEGELAALEAEWREAEEIAGIADNLTLPAGVEETATRLRGESRRDD
jgi:hypothetical protein